MRISTVSSAEHPQVLYLCCTPLWPCSPGASSTLAGNHACLSFKPSPSRRRAFSFADPRLESPVFSALRSLAPRLRLGERTSATNKICRKLFMFPRRLKLLQVPIESQAKRVDKVVSTRGTQPLSTVRLYESHNYEIAIEPLRRTPAEVLRRPTSNVHRRVRPGRSDFVRPGRSDFARLIGSINALAARADQGVFLRHFRNT